MLRDRVGNFVCFMRLAQNSLGTFITILTHWIGESNPGQIDGKQVQVLSTLVAFLPPSPSQCFLPL